MLRRFLVIALLILLVFSPAVVSGCTEFMTEEEKKEFQDELNKALDEAKKEAEEEVKQAVTDAVNEQKEKIKDSITGSVDEILDQLTGAGVYRVLSANVGNNTRRAINFKLLPNQKGERLIRNRIGVLKPDICAILEASNRSQVERLMSRAGKPYAIFGGPYDFLCINKDVVAPNPLGGGEWILPCPDGVDLDLGGDSGCKTSYVDLVFKEDSRPVRIIYGHFVGLDFTTRWQEIQISTIDWIADHSRVDYPVLVMGDFNNDFVRESNDPDMTSSIHIKQVIDGIPLTILNAKDLRTGDYFGTYRDLTGELEPRRHVNNTYDWVLGNKYVALDDKFQSGFVREFTPDSFDPDLDHYALFGAIKYTGSGNAQFTHTTTY